MVVTIIGDLDLQSVAQTQAFLRHATAQSPRHLIIDVSQVTFLSSSGISLLIGVGNGQSGRGGAPLAIAHHSHSAAPRRRPRKSPMWRGPWRYWGSSTTSTPRMIWTPWSLGLLEQL